jgi:hypothetical protein
VSPSAHFHSTCNVYVLSDVQRLLRKVHSHWAALLLQRSVRPDGSRWPDESLQAHPRCVDRALSGVQEHVVKPAAETAAEEGCDHWDPEVVAAGRLMNC